jgi:protein-disulfide isomerase
MRVFICLLPLIAAAAAVVSDNDLFRDDWDDMNSTSTTESSTSSATSEPATSYTTNSTTTNSTTTNSTTTTTSETTTTTPPILPPKPVHVKLYYETLCPVCQYLIIKHARRGLQGFGRHG